MNLILMSSWLFLINNQPKRLTKLQRCHLVSKKYAALFHLACISMRLVSKTDRSAFEAYFRFDIETFLKIKRRFKVYYEKGRLQSKVPLNNKKKWLSQGRPLCRYFTTQEALLCLLRYLTTGQQLDDLALLTTGVHSTLSQTLRLALHSLLAMLERWKPARICLPKSNEEAFRLAGLARNYIYEHQGINIAGNFIGTLDGKIVDRERPNDDQWQHTNHNGKSGTTATKVLLLQLFNGTYGAAVVNFIDSCIYNFI
jgi:hypothetical protein